MIIPGFNIVYSAASFFTGKLVFRNSDIVFLTLVYAGILVCTVWSFPTVFNDTIYYIIKCFVVYILFYNFFTFVSFNPRILKLGMAFIVILSFSYLVQYAQAWNAFQHLNFYAYSDDVFYLFSVNDQYDTPNEASGSDSTTNPTYTHPINKTIRWNVETTPIAIANTVGHVTKSIVENVGSTIALTGGLSAGAKVMASTAASPLVKIGGTLAVGAIGLGISEVTKNVTKARQGDGSRLLEALEDVVKKGSGSGFTSTPGGGQFHSFVPIGISNWWDIIVSFIPKDLTQDVIMRIPSGASEGVHGHYNLLFMKYNLLVYLMLGCLILLAFSYFLQFVLSLMQRNSNFLVEHTPKIIGLGRFASSKWPNILIIILRFSIFMNYWTMFQGIYFMYENYIPIDTGPIYDTVLANQTITSAEITNGLEVAQLPQQKLNSTVEIVET